MAERTVWRGTMTQQLMARQMMAQHASLRVADGVADGVAGPRPIGRPAPASQWLSTRAAASPRLSTRAAASPPRPVDPRPVADVAGAAPLRGVSLGGVSLGAAHPAFWARRGAGHEALTRVALAHVMIGLCAIVASVLIWYLGASADFAPLVTGGIALMVALAGAVAFELARFTWPRAALGARGLLLFADVAACGILLWLLGNGSFAPLLFVVPVFLSMLLFAARDSAICAALAIGVFVVASMTHAGFAATAGIPQPLLVDVWLPQTLALAGLALLVWYCADALLRTLATALAEALTRVETLQGQRTALRGEQRRLVEALRGLEDAQGRLEQERAHTNRQLGEVVRVAERLGDGDAYAVRALRPGMYGPLGPLANALSRVAHHVGVGQGQQQRQAVQQRMMDALAAAAREQGQLLATTDNALRELGGFANDLATEVQRLERGSGDQAGVDRRVLFQALHMIEQSALTQASNTAMLGARLAQLRARQTEIEDSIRRMGRGIPRHEPVSANSGERESAPSATVAAAVSAAEAPPLISQLPDQWPASSWGASGPRQG